MVTREEEHSTRGRSRMLFEMLQGEELKHGWHNQHVKDSLDLCLACKGCKADCPVNVDMAMYKSEFLAHYYKGKLRPRSAYAFGWVYWWSRLASLMPGLANFVMHAPLLSRLTKAIAGVAPQRKMPRFAAITFREWFANRKTTTNLAGKPKVILWPDTFNNHFLPQTLVAGTEVLEAAGFEVVIPEQSLCCGRPLYDFGMLKTAKRMLLQILDTLQTEIRQGTPIVGLEPSCVAVFRDELAEMLPHDQDAKRLQHNVFTLAEFLEKKAPDFTPPLLKQKAIVHAHCHHSAVMKINCDTSVLKKTGLDYTVLDSGCCGMAGYFGYIKGDQYEVSIKSGERALLPAVQHADAETIIIADGFSCREQIQQQTNRKGLHLAQVLQMALHENGQTTNTPLPEKTYVDGMKLRDPHRTRKTVLYTAVFATAFLATYLFKKSKSLK
jgi:Fe-S oxidoreductase